LIYERRPIQLTDQERKLHEQCLKTLNLRQVRRLVRHWEWQNGEAGAVLLAEGVPNDGLRILVSGEANVTVGGRQIARLNSCQFFGEMSFLTRNVTTAAVIATAPVRYAVIRDTLLQELSRRDPDFATALQAAIGTDLVHKLLKERI
jgi:CRP-like cAMP-binding protein